MQQFGKIWKVLSINEKKTAFVLLMIMVLSMLLEVLGIGLIIPFVGILLDSQLINKFPFLPGYITSIDLNNTNIIIFATLILATVFFIKNIFLAFAAWFNSRTLNNVNQRLSFDLFKNYLFIPYSFHLKNNSAKLIYNCTDAVAVFKEAIGHFALLVSELIVVTGISILLLFIEPKGFLITISILIILGYGYYRLNRSRLFEWGKALELNQKLRLQHLIQGLGAVKILKILGKQFEFLKRFEFYNQRSTKFHHYSTTLVQMPRFILEFFAVITISILLITLVMRGISNQEILVLLGVFGVAAIRLMPSANRIIGSLEKFRVCTFHIDTVYREFNLTKNINLKDLKKNENSSYINGSFKVFNIQNLHFKYEDAKISSLTSISLKINNGEYIGIIGKTGSGKSTLVDLITGVLEPNSGSIYLDNKDITHHMREWQKRIGYVPQVIYLTDDTLRRNIAFGISDKEIDDDKILKILDQCDLLDFFGNLKQGLNERMGEQGTKISGGEKQRVGIARALYHNPEVLILDESTSSLDSNTEKLIIDNLSKFKSKKTIIIVSHKQSSLKNCDRIIEVANGTIKNESNIGSYAKQ